MIILIARSGGDVDTEVEEILQEIREARALALKRYREAKAAQARRKEEEEAEAGMAGGSVGEGGQKVMSHSKYIAQPTDRSSPYPCRGAWPSQ